MRMMCYNLTAVFATGKSIATADGVSWIYSQPAQQMKEELKVLGVSKFSQGCLVGLEPEEDSWEVQNKVKSQMSSV